MRKQEVTCPNCGQLIEFSLPDYSRIVQAGTVRFEEYEPPVNRIYVKSNTHKVLFKDEYCGGFYIYVKHNNPFTKPSYKKPDWSVEI